MKRIISFAAAVMLLCAGIFAFADEEGGQSPEETALTEEAEITEEAMPPEDAGGAEETESSSGAESASEETAQDMNLTGDAEDAESTEPEAGTQSEEHRGTIFDLLDKSSISYEADLAAYYLSEMTAAAVAGDEEAGREACANRDYIIDANGMDCAKVAFDDLYLLAKLINAEAGSDWLTEDFRLCTGEVVLNRVASPEFPNTLYDVAYQPGQYSSVTTVAFANLIPEESFVDIALRLLQGERQMVESVVYQSNYIQGEIFAVYEDWRLGKIYFCMSKNLELYPIY